MSVDTSAGILALLAHDNADVVRRAVAVNQGTPTYVLRSLADDAPRHIRKRKKKLDLDRAGR
jgi:hypothetical protein